MSERSHSDGRPARMHELSGGRVVLHLDGVNEAGDKTAWVIGVPTEVEP